MKASLSPERWEQVQNLFDKVIGLDPAARTARLDEACLGDPELRAEVDSLVAAYEHADDLLQSLDQMHASPPSLRPPTTPSGAGTQVSHYEVIEKLGGGGMGIVYKAHDSLLRRDVALKFLSTHLTHNPEARQRFVVEAQAASALDHNNICTIYEIGQTNQGQTFIAMACYDGETIKHKIARGPMPLEEALDYAAQIAQGLSKAHSRGIIHRDIKPANLMVTSDKVVKILDFGLAKITDVHLTQTGMTMGTASYMSPEQARGEGFDHRTDIWSLGVVLYEMLTGEQPFKGDYAQAIIYNVLNQEPVPLTAVRPELPVDLERIIELALAKDVVHRYQTLADVMAELKWLRQGSGSEPALRPRPGVSGIPTAVAGRPQQPIGVVVLPFDDLSPDKDHEYFSDGLTDEIIIDLSQVKALNVITRTSAMMLKGTDKSIRTIGRELNVQYVLGGSVRKAGNNLRITAQLIDARNDKNVWAHKYRGTLDDIFDIQETVSQAIVEALEVQLTPEEAQGIAERPIPNVQAYECYLKARHEIWKFTGDALDRAVQQLQNGLDIVGENALLYAGLGYVHWQYVKMGVGPFDHLDKAEAYAQKVFDLEPESAHGYRLLGLISMLRGDVRATVKHLKQALALDPNDPDALFWLAIFYGCLGQSAAGMALAKRLLEIDPLSPMNQSAPGWIHCMAGRFSMVVEPFRNMYQMDSSNPVHGFFYALGLIYTRAYDDAYALIDQLAESAPAHPFTWMGLLFKYALQGDKAKALEAATPDLEAIARGDLQYSWFMATCYAMLQEKEQAVDWLENAVTLGFINYPLLNDWDPLLENIRGEAAFQALMEETRQQWEQFEV